MSNAEREMFAKKHLLNPSYPFGLMPSEIGCFLSHRKAWKEIAEGRDMFGLVAEDDVVVQPGFENSLQLALQHGANDSLIRFPMRNREIPHSTVASHLNVALFRPKTIGLTAALYLLGKDAAKTLLSRSNQFDRPVDTWLQMRWLTGVDSLTLWPSHIESAAASHGGSTIQAKRSRVEQVKRSWQRAKYRSAIKSLSAKS